MNPVITSNENTIYTKDLNNQDKYKELYEKKKKEREENKKENIKVITGVINNINKNKLVTDHRRSIMELKSIINQVNTTLKSNWKQGEEFAPQFKLKVNRADKVYAYLYTSKGAEVVEILSEEMPEEFELKLGENGAVFINETIRPEEGKKYNNSLGVEGAMLISDLKALLPRINVITLDDNTLRVQSPWGKVSDIALKKLQEYAIIAKEELDLEDRVSEVKNIIDVTEHDNGSQECFGFEIDITDMEQLNPVWKVATEDGDFIEIIAPIPPENYVNKKGELVPEYGWAKASFWNWYYNEIFDNERDSIKLVQKKEEDMFILTDRRKRGWKVIEESYIIGKDDDFWG